MVLSEDDPLPLRSRRVKCHCYTCGGSEYRALKTVKKHLKSNRKYFIQSQQLNVGKELLKELVECMRKTHYEIQSIENEKIIPNRSMTNICRQHTTSPTTFQSQAMQPDDDFDMDISPKSYMSEQMLEQSGQLQEEESEADDLSDRNGSDYNSPSDEESCSIHSPSVAEAELDLDLNCESGNVNEETTSFHSPLDSTTFSIPKTFQDSMYYKSISLPEPLLELRRTLLGSYKCPKKQPLQELRPRELSQSEAISLQHYITWWKTNGTTLAYSEYAKFLEHTTGLPIHSLYRVRRLAEILIDFQPTMVDMCPQSCMAYTGEFCDALSCDYMHKRTKCGQSRYKAITKGKTRSRSQFLVMPVMAVVKSLFTNLESATALRSRDSCLRAALSLVTEGRNPIYSDFPNGEVHRIHHTQMNLFQEPRDIAFAISSDGAQLTMKRQSNTRILILTLLNLPAYMRYKSSNTIIALAIPGPNAPGNIESYVYPLFQEMAMASEGLWVWDAVDSSYFVLHASVVMILGDMLGSAKLSGMAGHTANFGDRFTMVRSAKSSEPDSKAIYYPISPPQSRQYNPDRPIYSFSNLPYRREVDYWSIIDQLHSATTKTARATVTKETGVSRLPLGAASPAFRHPTFFPFDPFHLFYENCMAYFWDLWTKYCSPTELTRMDSDMVKTLGEYIADACYTLPPVFCGPIRNPHLKRQSQYKIYEWMALLHWYLVPICLELDFNFTTLENFSQFVGIVKYAMTIKGRTDADLQQLYQEITHFLEGFEELYVGDDPQNISRCRLCIFQLIHIPSRIKWNGSVRVSSQATVERSIGELGHRIRSRKAPFENLTRLLKEKAVVGMLMQYYPCLYPHGIRTSAPGNDAIELFSRQNFTRNESSPGHIDSISLKRQLNPLAKLIREAYFPPSIELERFGKLRLKNGHALHTALIELPEIEGSTKRYHRWFKGIKNGTDVFGEAMAFYKFTFKDRIRELVVYKPLANCERKLNVSIVGQWDENLQVLYISDIVSIVGIWRVPRSNRVYMLQKHPGLEMLSLEETELAPEDLVDTE